MFRLLPSKKSFEKPLSLPPDRAASDPDSNAQSNRKSCTSAFFWIATLRRIIELIEMLAIAMMILYFRFLTSSLEEPGYGDIYKIALFLITLLSGPVMTLSKLRAPTVTAASGIFIGGILFLSPAELGHLERIIIIHILEISFLFFETGLLTVLSIGRGGEKSVSGVVAMSVVLLVPIAVLEIIHATLFTVLTLLCYLICYLILPRHSPIKPVETSTSPRRPSWRRFVLRLIVNSILVCVSSKVVHGIGVDISLQLLMNWSDYFKDTEPISWITVALATFALSLTVAKVSLKMDRPRQFCFLGLFFFGMNTLFMRFDDPELKRIFWCFNLELPECLGAVLIFVPTVIDSIRYLTDIDWKTKLDLSPLVGGMIATGISLHVLVKWGLKALSRSGSSGAFSVQWIEISMFCVAAITLFVEDRFSDPLNGVVSEKALPK